MATRLLPKIAVAAGARALPARPVRGPYTAGDVIAAKYQLTSLLGEGGMGSVWAAKNLMLNVDVAVKLLRVEVDTPEAAVRLLREARAAAQLKHPCIVQVYDFGETELEDPFIVMEILAGGSLADLLDRKVRLGSAHAVRLLLPVASALGAAHDKGIVHRDLKPGNVVLTGAGDVVIPKVVDFGIAKLKNGEIDGCSTQAGVVLGSPDYMSPEQARGRSDIDERTDVWSLCVVLYEALTGRRPFEANNYNALINAIIEDLPHPVTDFAAGDAELWTIIERGLEKAPADRWPNMGDLGRALASWAVVRGIATDSTGTSLSRVWLGETAPAIISEIPPPPMAPAAANDRSPPSSLALDAFFSSAPARDPSGAISHVPGGVPESLRVWEREAVDRRLPTPEDEALAPLPGLGRELRKIGVADTLPGRVFRRRLRWAALPAAALVMVLLVALGWRLRGEQERDSRDPDRNSWAPAHETSTVIDPWPTTTMQAPGVSSADTGRAPTQQPLERPERRLRRTSPAWMLPPRAPGP